MILTKSMQNRSEDDTFEFGAAERMNESIDDDDNQV